ncbi:MAG: fused MFS/spermidine synthase [Nitrosomonadales bacterium]|nr:fused MFS/spermidine synthase [Nitrosomonadales bacterium]
MSYPIDISEEAGVRYLHFGSTWIQGAMRIARPWNLELEYTREMMASLLLREGGGKAAGHPPAYSSRVLREDARWPRKVLLIGLGAASLTKFLYRHRPLAHLTIVEIEPAVVAAAQQYFKLPEDDKRIHIVIGDGAEYVLGTNKKFDLILVDGFNDHAHPGELNTLPFYQACRTRLSNEGIMAVNLIGISRGAMGGFRYITQAFEDRALMFPSCESGNTIAFAAGGEPVDITFDELKENALALKQQAGLNLLPTLARLAQARTCLNDTLTL